MGTEFKAPRNAKTKHPATAKSGMVYLYTHKSARNLLLAFDVWRASRNEEGRAPRGATTDDEQDILRAMLVMAAAGLDALLKQLIRDALPSLVGKDQKVREGLENFVQKQVRAEDGTTEATFGAKFLGRTLAAPNTQQAVIEEYVRELTGDSLQSAEQVCKAARALGLEIKQLGVQVKELKAIFDIRNMIIHELDIFLGGTRRKRNPRRVEDLVNYTDKLLAAGLAILGGVDGKL